MRGLKAFGFDFVASAGLSDFVFCGGMLGGGTMTNGKLGDELMGELRVPLDATSGKLKFP